MIIWLLLVRAMLSHKRGSALSSEGCFGLFVMGLIELATVDTGIFMILMKAV